MNDSGRQDQYEGAAGGWGSVSGMARVARREGVSLDGIATLLEQNKAGGHMCTSCAFGKPAHPHPAEFCENGGKATLWDLTKDRCGPGFFAEHDVSTLRGWQDYDLEMAGRLTHPLRYNARTDHYEPCAWEDAFGEIGRALQAMEPKSTVFYASGKAALEPSYLYALFARMYGHNNLPDSSNMCHETTSVALKEAIGSPVGTCIWEDFDHCDAIFCFGQNTGSNSPRLLHQLQAAARRDCRIVVFNPIREQGLVRFVNPQSPLQMLTNHPTELACQYHQVRPGGDIAALLGICKHVLAHPHALDHDFIKQHTRGLEALVSKVEQTDWREIEQHSGLTRAALTAAGDVYLGAKRVIGVYGMGLTQQVHGSQSVQMLVNLLMLRGNLGREGAGISPMRGHSNVQGQRTVGISEKPDLVPLDLLAKQFDFAPPREHGVNTVAACEGILRGEIKGFIGFGGNFLRAIPDQDRLAEVWRELDLTVSVATKLNRTHLYPGRSAFLLPCLVRAEEDIQASGRQSVSMEDTFSHIHGSIGKRAPADANLRSEVAIVAGLAKATLPAHPKWNWDAWTADYARIRDLIEATYPDQFADFNARMFTKGGFYRGNAARERTWKTKSGKAEFKTPTTLTSLGIGDAPGRFHLTTIRSNDQFNTTIYGFSDRLRGLSGSRMVVLINRADMARMNLSEGEQVTLTCDTDDGIRRSVEGLSITPFNVPDGCLAGYYPELNPLLPLWYHDEASGTPAAKGIPVRIQKRSAAAKQRPVSTQANWSQP